MQSTVLLTMPDAYPPRGDGLRPVVSAVVQRHAPSDDAMNDGERAYVVRKSTRS